MIAFIKEYKYDIIIVIVSLIFAFYLKFNFAVVKINGSSMSPTYEHGEILVIKRHKTPKIGDLIIFTAPEWNDDDYKLIKRIAGTMNDEIYINNQSLIVNENSELHLKRKCYIKDTKRIFLNENEFLVAGDNKANSNDSIYHLCLEESSFKIPKENVYVIGTELFVLGRLFNE